ncbi:hypothetical protein D9619_010569 [Psilocybe cf. subviscida]|uniref:Uncharacterized protein n=1 Tax=Psilocybe cf. subviscida TaxID=2480587 RepID=A0A8H5AS52_9AGAR|nr:hypothetical protein D9619_010569 [Psilocybe cf. subviscida]
MLFPTLHHRNTVINSSTLRSCAALAHFALTSRGDVHRRPHATSHLLATHAGHSSRHCCSTKSSGDSTTISSAETSTTASATLLFTLPVDALKYADRQGRSWGMVCIQHYERDPPRMAQQS